MMKNGIFFSISAVWLFLSVSCTDVKKNYVARVKLSELTANDLYNKELVYDVIFDSEEIKNDSVKNKSHQLFLKGIDLYKNQKKVKEAIMLFKQALVIFPNSKAYYELGNALLELNGKANTKEAIEAYEVAEYLNFKPSSLLFYKMASAHNIATNSDEASWSAINYLRRAFDEGFSDTALIRSDKNINSIINFNEYKSLLIEMSANKFKNNPEDLFDLYLKSFPTASQPFEITLEKTDARSSQSISYDFAKFIPEMQNTSFGREVSHDFFVISKIAETPKYIAVVYSSVNFEGMEMAPTFIKLVTYDLSGNIIASKLIAGQFSAEKVRTAKIEKNEIMLEDYARIWEQPIDKVSFDENEVKKYELLAKAQYLLDDSGKIIEQSVPANYSDSAVIVKN